MDFFKGIANILIKEMWWLLNEYIFCQKLLKFLLNITNCLKTKCLNCYILNCLLNRKLFQPNTVGILKGQK